AFLASSANLSGVSPADAAAFLGRVATRSGDLWPDSTLPVVALVASTFEDDTGVVASVEGEGAGVVRYTGTGKTITFGPGDSPSFTKYVTRYDENSPNRPEIHFLVGDSAGQGSSNLEARLLRETQGNDVLVVPTGPRCRRRWETATTARSP